MAAGASRQYNATFAIGAKLLGSFRGAMAAAQQRMKSLHAAAGKVASSVKKLAFVFSGLFSLFGAFLAANVFSRIFGSAQDEAVDAEQRTRSLLDSLMQMDEIRKKGPAAAQKQLELIYKHNEGLEKEGVLRKDVLDTMSVQLAISKLPSAAIQDTVDVMQNLLIKTKGVKGATVEAAQVMAQKWAMAARRGTIRGAGLGIAAMTPDQAKAFKAMSFPERVRELIRLGKAVGALNKESRDTPIGRIQLFNNALADLAKDIGKELLPAQAELADSWRKALPELKPALLASMKALMWAAKKLGEFVTNTLLPAWAEFQVFAATTLAPILDMLKVKFNYMISMIGPAFAKMLGVTAENGKTWKQVFGDALIKVLTALGDAFVWIGDNASWLVPTVTTLAIAFGALLIAFEVATAIAAIANPVGLIIIGIGALITAVVLLYENWDKIKAQFPTIAAVVETVIEGWKVELQFFIDFVQAIWKTLVAVFTGDFTGLGDAWHKVWDDIIAVVDYAKGLLSKAFQFIGDAAKKYFLKVLENIKTLWNDIKNFSFKDLFSKQSVDAATAYGQAVSTGQATGAAAGVAGGGASNAGGVVAGGGVGARQAAGLIAKNVTLPPEALAKIASERAPIVEDLQRPEIRNLVSATLAREMGTAETQKDVLENLVNRAVAMKAQGTYHGVENMIKGGFYGPWNRGETQATMAKGLSDARSQQVKGMIDEVAAGRNAMRGMTDQGVNVGPREYIGGEGYSYKAGLPQQFQSAAFLESQKALETANLAKMATGGIVGKPTLSLIGEKGPEAVVPLNNKTKTSAPATSVHFNPVITVHGNMSDQEQVSLDARLRDLSRDFVANFKRAQAHERRLSYEGGYG